MISAIALSLLVTLTIQIGSYIMPTIYAVDRERSNEQRRIFWYYIKYPET